MSWSASTSRGTVPMEAATAPATSTSPALYTLSHQVRRTTRFPARTPTAAVAGPTPEGSKRTAMSAGRAPRLTFCSGAILTGYRSVRTIAATHAGMRVQRHGSAAANPPRAATAASPTPRAGMPTSTARSGVLSAANFGGVNPPSGGGHVEVQRDDGTAGPTSDGGDMEPLHARNHVGG